MQFLIFMLAMSLSCSAFARLPDEIGMQSTGARSSGMAEVVHQVVEFKKSEYTTYMQHPR